MMLRQPISGTNALDQPIMILGFQDVDWVLAVDDEGHLSWISIDGIKVDWRYDWRAAAWLDVSPFGDSDGDTETPDDRGEEIPGDLPDADGADGGREGEVRDDPADRGVVSGTQGATGDPDHEIGDLH